MVESVALNSGCSSGIVKTIKSHAYDVLLFYKFPPTMIAPETGHGAVSHTKQKPRAISITKKKLEDLSSLRINWLKSKFTISSCSLLSNRFSLIVGAGVHVRSKCREEIKRLVLLIKMSQIQQRTSPNSPRHYYGKMDNPLSTTILPWVAVLRDKFCRKSEDMEELSGPCTAPSKSRIPALSTSYLPQMKLSPSFQRSFLWTGKEVFFF